MSSLLDMYAVWASKLARLLFGWLRESRLKISAWLRSDEHLAQRTAVTVAAVAVLHAAFLAFIVWGLRLSDASQIPRELHVAFYGPRPPVALPLAATPPDVSVMQPPDIVIADDTAALAFLAAPASSVLAPRADPSHPNPIPSSANLGVEIGAQATVILRLIVSSEGAVLQATVTQSSGQNVLDAAIEAFVREKWRFLPATLNGAPIQYATTAAIPVSAGG